jgi:hypothetical protein
MQWGEKTPAPYWDPISWAGSLENKRPLGVLGSLGSLGEPLRLLYWKINKSIRRMRLIFFVLRMATLGCLIYSHLSNRPRVRGGKGVVVSVN